MGVRQATATAARQVRFRSHVWRWIPLVVVIVMGAFVQPWLRSQYRALGWPDLIEAVALAPLAIVAALLIRRQPLSALGPLLALIVTLFAVARAADAAVQLDVSRGGTSIQGWRVTVHGATVLPAATLAMTFVTLLLPNGHLPSRRWRPVAWATAAAIVAYVGGVLRIWPEPIGSIAGAVGWFAVVACAVVSLAAVVWRCLCGRHEERAALAVVLGAGALPTAAMLALVAVGAEDSTTLALPWIVCFGLLLPGSVLVAALVSEPQAAPPVARRLVLGALTIGGVLIGLSVAAAVGLAVAKTTLGATAGIAAAGLTLLALAWPGRLARVGVLRLLYGRRNEPFALVRRAAAQAGATEDRTNALHAILVDLRNGLRVSGIAVQAPDGTVVAQHGEPIGPVCDVPLVDVAGQCGRLAVGARSAGEELTATDRDVLAALAPHLAVVAADSLLVQQLRGSRTRIVHAREEERRRLRRDLHDSLGAALSGIGYGLDAATLADIAEAPARLAAVRAQLSDVQGELRRIIDNLRPPILDSAGLVAAVRADTAARDNGRTRIDVTADDLGALPAAIELAAYRVVQEALSNALRHAAADHVQIRLHSDGRWLTVTVSDDGVGLPQKPRSGVGLRSMAERVSEVGGTLSVTTSEPGTQVTARVPLAMSHSDGAGGPVPTGPEPT